MQQIRTNTGFEERMCVYVYGSIEITVKYKKTVFRQINRQTGSSRV